MEEPRNAKSKCKIMHRTASSLYRGAMGGEGGREQGRCAGSGPEDVSQSLRPCLAAAALHRGIFIEGFDMFGSPGTAVPPPAAPPLLPLHSTSGENLTVRPRTPHPGLPSLPQMIANEISAASGRVGEHGFPLSGSEGMRRRERERESGSLSGWESWVG